MKMFGYFLVIMMVLLVACGGAEATGSATSQAVVEEVVEEPAAALEPEEESDPGQITSVEDMTGIWEGSIAAERGYVMYTSDGRFLLALSQDNLSTAPRVSGEYWFEDGQIHLRDLENAGYWAVCDAESVGVYDIAVDDGGMVQFQTISDDCNEGGFTRNYVFANMIQEKIAEATE